MSSDKALYLATFRLVIAILIIIATGFGLTAFEDVFPLSPTLTLFSVFCYLLAVIIGIYAFSISGLDTRAKVTALVEKLDSELADLKTKLDLRTHKSG